MIRREVLESLRKLPNKVYTKLIELHRKFEEDSTQASLHVEPLQPMARDPKVRSARLGLDYRAILIAPEVGDTYVLVHVDHHDKAYKWCENKLFEAHQEHGTFQIIDVESVERIAEESCGSFYSSEQESDYCLNKLTDEELFQAGTPKVLIPAIRSVQNDDDFDKIAEYLPPEASQVLYGVAYGLSLNQAIEEMLGATADHYKPESTGDFSHLSEASNFDLLLVEGEEHLKKILSEDIAAWRIYLHPYQRKLVEWDVKGPMKITGAAGTGKTVVLMHRAVWLASQANDDERVLITTFTTNLAVTIRGLIDELSPEYSEKIDVINLHKLARKLCSQDDSGLAVVEQNDIQRIWEKVFADKGGSQGFSPAFIAEEYDQIIDKMGIFDCDQYMDAVRKGRPRIMKKQRLAIWPYFSLFKQYLADSGQMTVEGMLTEARNLVKEGSGHKYRHVLVDELQDFGLEALKFIESLSPSDEGLPNPLCLVGDGHQRLYNRTHIPLSRAGINIVGRSRRLKINYRTSEEVRSWSHSTLSGISVDDLDGNSVETTADQSLFHGNEPVLEKAGSVEQAAEQTIEWVQEILDKNYIKDHEICLTPMYPALKNRLSRAGITVYELRAGQQDPGKAVRGIRYGTKKRIKGLEFRAVGLLMNKDSTDSLARFEDYVAATRAREELLAIELQ